MTSVAINDPTDHTVCGDAHVLVPREFAAEFGKRRNVKSPQLACSTDIFKMTMRSMTASLPEAKWQYAMKTNDHLGLIAIALLEGHGLDCSSIGEILLVKHVAEALNMDVKEIMGRCSLGNPNKTTADIKQAFDLGVREFSVDSTETVDKMAKVAKGAHVYIRTYIDATQKTAISAFTNKFGKAAEHVPDLAVHAKKQGLVPYAVGLSVGGGNIDPDAFALAVEVVAELNETCRFRGVDTMRGITYCGGLPAPTAPGAPTFKTIGDRIRAACNQHGVRPEDVTFEPGRSLATTCGIIEAHVITMKAPENSDGVYDLIIDVGPFKGTFEFIRTDLTYKMAAYFGEDEEMVPARILDDTCDSKGVCFKGQVIMVPKSLVEGSPVYLLDTGSYTTAYVMQGFNRTLYLVSFCFPDPMADVVSKLPQWLQGVELPGEAAHRGKDMTALWKARQKLTTNDQRVSFSVENANGSGRLGMGLLPRNQWKRARALNSALIRFNGGKTGSSLQMGFQQQYLFEFLQECWIANNSFLTHNLWTKFATITANGGGTVYFCLSNQYKSSAKLCTLMHGSLLIKPANSKDGPRQFVEVNYDPYTLKGLDRTVVDRAFGNALRNEKVYRDPAGQFEQLLAGERLDPALANADLVWGGPIATREPLSTYWPDATAKNGTKRPIDLEGALAFDLDAEQFSVLLRLLAFLNASYDAGYMVSNNAHDDANQCMRTCIRFLVTAMMKGKDHHFGDDWTTDQVIGHLAKLARQRLWVRETVWEPVDGGHSILDMDRFELDAGELTADEFMGNVRSILSHPTMMEAFGGENAYNTTYMAPPSLPHREYDAQQLYKEDAMLALTLLEEKASYTGALEEGVRSFY